MDRIEQTDPIWRLQVVQKGPIPLIRLNGETSWIDTSENETPDDAVLSVEEELHITQVTCDAQSALRTDFASAFSGPSWPDVSVIVEPLRLYSVEVFDANAKSYKATVRKENKDPRKALSAMVRNLLSELFGGEWDTCPGEQVVRTQWEHGANGWVGHEILTIAGDDPDPNCLYHRIVGDSIQHRYRFHAPLPQPNRGDPPGIDLSNLEWWRYIGLNERHNLAMVIKPYLDDRSSYWQFTFSRPARDDENEKVKQTDASSTVSPESSKEIHPDSLFLGKLNNPILMKIMDRLRKELEQNDHYIGEVARLFDILLSQILIFCADRLDATSRDIGTRGDYRFRSDARESDLQSDLREWLLGNLQYGEVGAEVSGVGTGRADICVTFDGIRFVVELKREDADANRAQIQKYIQQVVAYQTTNVRIGFLGVLDLTRQGKPVPHLEDNIWIEPFQIDSEAQTRHIVVFRVTGNLVRPSKSTKRN